MLVLVRHRGGIKEGEEVTCTYTNTFTKASPSISTKLSESSGSIGDTVHDTSSLTGATANFGTGMKRGIEICAKEFNDAGGYQGRKVDITVLDGVTNETVAHPHVQVAPGVPAEVTTDGTPQFKIRALGEKNGHAEVSMQTLDGKVTISAV